MYGGIYAYRLKTFSIPDLNVFFNPPFVLNIFFLHRDEGILG